MVKKFRRYVTIEESVGIPKNLVIVNKKAVTQLKSAIKKMEEELLVDQEVKGYELLEMRNRCCPGDDVGYGYLEGIKMCLKLLTSK